ncbi:MAG: hypothetical protein KAY24_00810 [Candidatus Eisenbacteria sp.]|nr:hypothetical protein [Candidatus Eisenbacteria bacterium]
MRQQIDLLQQLRDLDDQIQTFKGQVRARETDVRRTVMEESLIREALEREKAKLDAAKFRHRDANQNIDACQMQLKHFEKQLSDVKTNTEYQALLREIASLKTKVGQWEEQALEAMEIEEVTERHIEKLGKEMQVKAKLSQAEKTQLDQEVQEIGVQVEQLRMARTGVVEKLTPQIRSKYERLSKSKGETVIVAVVDGACGGCHYSLPPRTGAAVRRADQLVFCEGCGRILVTVQTTEVP